MNTFLPQLMFTFFFMRSPIIGELIKKPFATFYFKLFD